MASQKAHQTEARSSESDEKRKHRLTSNVLRYANSRATESLQERENHICSQKAGQAVARITDTYEQRENYHNKPEACDN